MGTPEQTGLALAAATAALRQAYASEIEAGHDRRAKMINELTISVYGVWLADIKGEPGPVGPDGRADASPLSGGPS